MTDNGPEVYDVSVAHPQQTADLNSAAHVHTEMASADTLLF